MKRMITTIALMASLGLLVIPTFAATGSAGSNTPSQPAAAKKVVSAVCPVMGTKIPDITKAAGKSVYKGKTYYFCCKGCKPAFDKNPEKYINKK